MHLRNRLNVKTVAGLSRPNVYADGGGLYLRVRKTGTKSWVFIFTLNGKRREIGLGSTLDVSLAEARQAAEDLRKIQLSGRDPSDARKQARQIRIEKPLFGSVADDLIDSIEGGFRNEKHRKQWRSSIHTYGKSLLSMPIDKIETADVLAVLQPIWLSKQETASRVRQRIERILDAAIAKGLRVGDNPARLKGNLEFLLPRKQKGEGKHHDALPFDDIAEFLSDLVGRKANAARALEFLILTAARTSEVLGMRWHEVDFDKRIWAVPAERMKMSREHLVPLSDSALKILSDARPQTASPQTFVFQGPSGGAMSNMAMLNLLKRMDVNVTVHGFRSTFRDWAGEKTSHAREEVEMALAHETMSKTERAYRRGNALEKRTRLMADWADFCYIGQRKNSSN